MTFTRYIPPVVVDASAAIEYLSANPDWRDNFDRWAADDRMLLAPAHFMPEVANGQLARKRIPATEVARRLERLSAVGIETADRGLIGLLEAIDLADRHRLTVDDALYLQLAIDADGELATLDGDLARAAQAEGITVIAP
jgi:predicted nucleic acid-binding protein